MIARVPESTMKVIALSGMKKSPKIKRKKNKAEI